MEDNLVGYLLNALDPLTQRQVEAYLDAHPDARARLELLRQALAPLEADRDVADPPPGLADRTLQRVAESPAELPRTPKVASEREFGSPRTPWRRADVLVAAVLLLAVLGTMFPWVLQIRARGERPDNPAHLVQCQNNLRQFYQALRAYHDHHRHFPNVNDIEGPRPAAGMVVPYLIDQGYLPRSASVHCPSAGGSGACPWTLKQLQAMSPEEFDTSAPHLNPGYAYSLGYLEQSVCLSVSLVMLKPSSLQPLMADCAAEDATKGDNSPNHGGKGQNVLFADGSVSYKTSRLLNGDDLYLNKFKKVAAGASADDSPVGNSAEIP
jgi:prepilin-type processing-associated H-X9-DG protein